MGNFVDLTELQRVVGGYAEQHRLLVATGPLTASAVLKAVATKSKLVNVALAGSGVWFAVEAVSKPVLALIGDQFAYLQSIFSMFRG